MHLGAADFGPVGRSSVRVTLAALALAPLLSLHGLWPALRQHGKAIAFVGIRRRNEGQAHGCEVSR